MKRFLTALIIVLKTIAVFNCEDLPPSCDSLVYCQGDLLHTVQMARLEDDSKTFVDKTLINDVQTTLNNFNRLMNQTNENPSPECIQTFIDDNFLSETELDPWTPEDFVQEPSFLERIHNKDVRDFARNVVGIWPALGRRAKDIVAKNPEKHSLIYVPNGFIIPGGRFREYYYWDSYWILKGLLLSEMVNTTKGIIENFLSIVDRYGHVPNGGRIYYSQRSQPPLLSFMAKDYFDKTRNLTWLKSNIETLEKEVQFWVEKRLITLNLNGQNYSVGVHDARSAGPRPESYYEDVKAAGVFENENKKTDLYIQLKSAAETGWDFSSRWIFDNKDGTKGNISYTKTNRIAPVDLNSFLYGAFNNLASLYSELNEAEKQIYWKEKAYEINKTINDILWNDRDGIWYDFDIHKLKPRKYFYASNLTPLWTKAYNTEETHTSRMIIKIIHYLKEKGITDFYGGIPSTIENTGEQWDLPNAWPCSQAIIVNGLEDTDTKLGRYWAREFAERWVLANMIGYNETGYMFEKYNAEIPGKSGGGGEYEAQNGFGWTNGVALEFIAKYFSTN